jgi:hypothetical protein
MLSVCREEEAGNRECDCHDLLSANIALTKTINPFCHYEERSDVAITSTVARRNIVMGN